MSGKDNCLKTCFLWTFVFALFPLFSIFAVPSSIDSFTEESAWIQSVFQNKSPLTWEEINKNRFADSELPSEGELGMNIPSSHSPSGFLWNDGDIETKAWYPQGITGTSNLQTGSRYLATSWYSKKVNATDVDKGVRITFVDYRQGAQSIKYRHVLLVQDKDNGLYHSEENSVNPLNGFAPVNIHAGGIAWYQNLLYVADTHLGIRVFDVSRIFEADEKKSGAHYAFNYKYVLPQIGYYKTHGTKPNSFISVGTMHLGNGSYAPALWTGNYLKSDSAQKPSLFGYLLNPDGFIDTFNPPKVIQPKDKNGGPVYNMQGVYRSFGKTFLSVTGKSKYKGSTARLITQKKDSKNGKRWRWPHGAEDLYLDEFGILWCLTEYPPQSQEDLDLESTRVVFGVELSTY